MSIRSLFTVAGVLLLVVACGGAPAVVGSRSAGSMVGEANLEKRLDELGYSDWKEVKRLSNFRLNGWSSVDDYHVIINSGPSRNYLVEFRSACYGLDHANSIGFKTAMSSVSKGDRIIVQDSGEWHGDCWISAIYELVKKPKEEKTEG